MVSFLTHPFALLLGGHMLGGLFLFSGLGKASARWQHTANCRGRWGGSMGWPCPGERCSWVGCYWRAF